MSVLTALLSFAAVAGLLTIVPGLDTALVLRAAVTRDRRHAFATALGIGTGTLVWGAAAAAGISIVLTASQVAYTVLRLAGAAYLLWFGTSSLVALWRSRHAERPESAIAEDELRSPGLVCSWLRGTLTNLLNPKVGVFYVAMLPQFIPAGVPHLAMGLALAAVHDLEGMLWFTVLIIAAHTARSWITRRAVRRAMEAVTGSVLLAFGLRLALSNGP